MYTVKLLLDPSCDLQPQLGGRSPSQGQGAPFPSSREASPNLPHPGELKGVGTWHPQPHSCPSCPQNHVNLVHRKGKTKVCPHPGCGKKFYLSNHLRRHMIIHSGQAQGGAGRVKPRHRAAPLSLLRVHHKL